MQEGAAGEVAMSDLDRFELLLAPKAFSFAMTPDDAIVIQFENPPNGSTTASTYVIPVDIDADIAAQVSELIGAIIDEHALFEIEPSDPDRAFADAYMSRPSLHLRVGYGDFHWQTWHPKGSVPENLDGVIRDCYGLALLLARMVPIASEAVDLDLVMAE